MEKEKCLSKLAEAKQLGKHKEWFEETFYCLMRSAFEHEGIREGSEEKGILELLKENQVSIYRDSDFLQMILDREQVMDSCVFFAWYARDIINRKVIVDRSSIEGAAYLKELFLGEWNEREREDEAYLTRFLMAMEWTQVTDSALKLFLTPEEKATLAFNQIELTKKCIVNGMLRRELAPEYIDYAMEKGCFAQVPLLVAWYNQRR